MKVSFLIGRATVLAALMTSAQVCVAEPRLRLENECYVVEVSQPHGLITRIRDKHGGLELLQEQRLADNFKFSLPIRGKHAWQATEGNYVLGKDQRLSSHILEGSKLELVWGGPLTSVLGKRYDVSAMMTIELAGEEVQFALKIRNRSKLEIGEVYYPILGGTLGLGDGSDTRKGTELVVPGSREIRKAKIFQTFANFSWLGVLGPEQFYSYPDTLSMPWLELNQPALKRSVYFGAHDSVARYKVIHLEMSPGIAGNREGGNWPRPEELKGAPAGVKICFVQMPYQPAGREFEATPAVLRCHAGDWRVGAKIYGDWLASQYDLCRPRGDWLYRTPAFQECDGVRFKELPAWAKQAVAVGVRCLLLSGWKIGGDRNGIPRFEPEPRLGTPEELAEASRQCHELGVKLALVVDLGSVNQSSDIYRKELHSYSCQDRWGIDYSTVGWSRGSPLTGGYGGGDRRVWLNPGHPGMRSFLVKQLRALAALGIDGVHLQDFFGRPLDFNVGTGRTADRASWEGGLECLREILRACRTERPEFALSTDTAWDRVLELTQVSSVEAGESNPLRVAFSSWQPAFTLADDDGIAAINKALCYRARLRIATADKQAIGGPATAGIAGYLKAVLAVREALSQTLLDGESLGAEALSIEGSVTRNVFRNKLSGLRTAVLVNARAEATTMQVAGFADATAKPVWLWQPSTGTTNVAFPARVEILGRQVAVLTEEDAIQRLNGIARWAAPAANEKVIFDLASSQDLEGWTLKGNAFSVATAGELVPRPTLNSLALGGETATGTTVSPAFVIEPRFDEMEIVFQGGWNQATDGEENLILRLLDADNGAVLERILPPGTHVLTTRHLKLDKLTGKTIRIQMVDNNTDSSFAWIGLRKVSLRAAQLPEAK